MENSQTISSITTIDCVVIVLIALAMLNVVHLSETISPTIGMQIPQYSIEFDTVFNKLKTSVDSKRRTGIAGLQNYRIRALTLFSARWSDSKSTWSVSVAEDDSFFSNIIEGFSVLPVNMLSKNIETHVPSA